MKKNYNLKIELNVWFKFKSEDIHNLLKKLNNYFAKNIEASLRKAWKRSLCELFKTDKIKIRISKINSIKSGCVKFAKKIIIGIGNFSLSVANIFSPQTQQQIITIIQNPSLGIFNRTLPQDESIDEIFIDEYDPIKYYLWFTKIDRKHELRLWNDKMQLNIYDGWHYDVKTKVYLSVLFCLTPHQIDNILYIMRLYEHLECHNLNESWKGEIERFEYIGNGTLAISNKVL